jgi:protein-ribulosamine 3-kinase
MALDTNQTQFFESILFESLGCVVHVLGFQFVSGGSINTAVKVDSDEGSFFVKWNESDQRDMFEAEAQGLELLRRAGEIRVPEVVAYGQNREKSYLILEYIASSSPEKNEFWQRFGNSLAALHQHSHPQFGLAFNNYIGSLPQNNEYCESGIQFFIEKRLKVQAGLALYNGEISPTLHEKFQRLYEILPSLLPDEKPALLHGDLWSGNYLIDDQGSAVLIDPAVYYGNREAEMAFTHLFGGFEPAFYHSYFEVLPVATGFNERIPIYNLYPLMVHVNLFGSGYLSAVERTLTRLVG